MTKLYIDDQRDLLPELELDGWILVRNSREALQRIYEGGVKELHMDYYLADDDRFNGLDIIFETLHLVEEGVIEMPIFHYHSSEKECNDKMKTYVDNFLNTGKVKPAIATKLEEASLFDTKVIAELNPDTLGELLAMKVKLHPSEFTIARTTNKRKEKFVSVKSNLPIMNGPQTCNDLTMTVRAFEDYINETVRKNPVVATIRKEAEDHIKILNKALGSNDTYLSNMVLKAFLDKAFSLAISYAEIHWLDNRFGNPEYVVSECRQKLQEKNYGYLLNVLGENNDNAEDWELKGLVLDLSILLDPIQKLEKGTNTPKGLLYFRVFFGIVVKLIVKSIGATNKTKVILNLDNERDLTQRENRAYLVRS